MKKVLIKIGGQVASNKKLLKELACEINAINDTRFFIVHGGGVQVTSLSEKLGLKAVFENGKRKTTPEEMDVVDMVLAGKMNKYIVRLFSSCGLNTVGISGADGKIFTGKRVSQDSRTGEITETNPELLSLLLKGKFLPIISSVSMDKDGTPLNINADDVALAVAKSIPVDDLIFISDIPGILKNNNLIKSLNITNMRQEIEAGVITGGMIPKVESSAMALQAGVKSVIIGGYLQKGDLANLLDGNKGTKIKEV